MKRFRRWALLIPTLVVAVIWYLLWLHPATRDDPWYARIALEIGVIAVISILYQLVRTTGWTIRAMGVLGYVLGSAALYLVIAGDHWTPLGHGWKEGITDLAGAVLVVGGLLLLWGMVATEIDDRRRARENSNRQWNDDA